MSALAPAVMVHDRAQGRAALAGAAGLGQPVTLLSGPGAAIYAGSAWWRALMAELRADAPAISCADLLDCADAPGAAAQALRLGQKAIIFDHPEAALVAAIARRCATHGALLLAAAPPALDLAAPGAERHLAAWLSPGRGRAAG